MTKTICDFCGREMETTSDLLEPISNYNFCISCYGNKLDICDDCRKSLNEWWDQRKKLGEVGESEKPIGTVDEVVDESVDECHFLCRHNENMRCKIGRNGAKCLKETLGR